MEINKIKVGKRFRKDIGELETLKTSIEEIGLLQPIVVDEKDNLIAGQRRLIACKELGMKNIKVNVVKIEDALRGEYDENVIRKGFVPSEEVAIWEAMESKQFQKGGRSESEQRDKPIKQASKLLGKSTDTLSKAKQVVESGDEKLIEKMDKTGNVNSSYHIVKNRKRLEKIPEIPKGKYEVLLADPPWRYDSDGFKKSVESHYPTMDLQELCALGEKIKEISAKNCVLFLWTTSAKLDWAMPVIEAWGFKYKSSMIWDKVKHNMGFYSSIRHEFLLIAGKGSSTPKANGKIANSIDSVQSIEKSSKHSEKPEEFRKIIEKLYPNTKKIELFARKKVEGWTVWGNEA